ncbi:MAG: HNH endonuclease, partial [Deltaproteobacteria bacterium]|nr:HNH endonuclease [Deltaproteobacteria bacterium]
VHVDRAALAAGAEGTHDRRDDPHAPGAAELAPHATLADGTPLALATVRRLACDATVVLVDDTHAGAAFVDETRPSAAVVAAARDTDGASDARGDARDTDGTRDAHATAREASGAARLPSRRTRRISPRLRRALRLRDDGCRFPGCTNRITDAHHVVPWIDGGATTLSNTLSLCRRHHRFVHEHGYRVLIARDGAPRFFRRDGQPVPLADEPLRSPLGNDSHPGGAGGSSGATGAAAAPDALAALRAAHAARGLAIDATTALPRWDGTPLDAHLAVQALLGAADLATARDW